MIRHEYTGCNQCHADPTGGGLLTAYGRAQGELLLRTQYGKPLEEAGKPANFLWFADPPESVLLGGDLRYFYYDMMPSSGPSTHDNFFMQADLEGQVSVNRFKANASIGYAQKGALPASITQSPNDNLVSRVHWIGYDLDQDKQWLVRAGRMNLPFGNRSIEHTLFVRSQTLTDTNEDQQDGVSVAMNVDKFRGELMAIAGNYNVNPDEFRQRGYCGFIEWSPMLKTAVGVSSMITHADKDVQLLTPAWRQAHGVFGRWSPHEALVVLAESNLILTSQPPNAVPGQSSAVNTLSWASMLQADVEPIQGVHVMATGELLDMPTPPGQPSGIIGTTWASAAWFFAPHADVRLDAVYMAQSIGSSWTVVLQGHVFL